MRFWNTLFDRNRLPNRPTQQVAPILPAIPYVPPVAPPPATPAFGQLFFNLASQGGLLILLEDI